MRPTYNKSKIMRNAWYLKRVQSAKSFGECLRKAWRNEKMAIATARIEGRTLTESKATNHRLPTEESFIAGCLACYAEARPGQYFGD